MEEFVKNIDYRMLTSQKNTLLKLLENPTISKMNRDNIDGIVNFIDNLQDAVVENEILSKEEVFPYLENTEN